MLQFNNKLIVWVVLADIYVINVNVVLLGGCRDFRDLFDGKGLSYKPWLDKYFH